MTRYAGFFLAFAFSQAAEKPVQVVVMDPLSLPLSCSCVEGVGQRRYDQLGDHLGKVLGRSIKLTFEESLDLALRRIRATPDFIIGKDAMVSFDSKRLKLQVTPIADLTDRTGAVTQRGVFIVRTKDPARRLADLSGRSVMLGPEEEAETHQAAKAALRKARLAKSASLEVAGAVDSGALALTDGEVSSAVVPEYLPPLLVGCEKVSEGSVRVLAKTPPVPGVRLFRTDAADDALVKRVLEEVTGLDKRKELLVALESVKGFVKIPDQLGWPDWRGPGRRGQALTLPRQLPKVLQKVWSTKLTGPAVAGPAATDKWVIIPDKSRGGTQDLFRCLDVNDGSEVWRLEYEADRELDYSNSPRATPVVHDGLVYLLGALGDLHCLRLETGEVVWRTNYYREYGGKLLPWGSSAPPLIVAEKLIINPGVSNASLVALDRKTGRLIWKTSGHAAAYSAFVVSELGGRQQIVGYDSASLGGWDPDTGKRIWQHIPTEGSDFNVTTPLIYDGQLLLATENNGTRLHQFSKNGTPFDKPVMANPSLAPDTCSPVIVGDRGFATAYGEMYCLDLKNNLKTVWVKEDDMFYDHSNVIGGNGRVLVWTQSGDLLLLDAAANKFSPLSRLRPFGDSKVDSMSHPAIVGNRIYLRGPDEIACFQLSGD
ncbi:MAG: PQQ-binding-like beta-propeller repeat protein [Verrucomicrobiota bacterium]|jgi:outer membrane protein assembly factor BamB/ABC-type phosphate/phosphonate transport system substrate-binding protein|nr:PQQ-binding-like beta-propeller repeat protein [Verrucomicrobiota bacterium]